MPPRKFLPWASLALAIGSAHGQVALDRPMRPIPLPVPATALLAEGFDFPVGRGEARGYYKARGFSLGNHPAEDWDGVGGGDSDFNDPVQSIGDGTVIYARDAHSGWGNVVIVRHQFRDRGALQTVDALFGHLNTMLVQSGQRVTRGQKIGTIGTAHGRYPAHLHFEIRKNLDIGINRAAYPQNFSCYYDPTKFIASHRGHGARPEPAGGLFAYDRTLRLPPPEKLASRRKESGRLLPAEPSTPLVY